MINKIYLLLLDGIIWLSAGFNILSIGLKCYKNNLSLLNIILSIIIFLLFHIFVFSKLVKKHSIRILGYIEEKQYFWKFFDLKSLIIMIFMITLGVCIRTFKLAPISFIAFFYTGLGSALILAGINFINIFRKERK